MSPDTTISVSLILSVISCVGVIVAIISTFKKDNESRTNEKLDIEKNFVKVNVKLDNFCDSINALVKQNEKATDEIRYIRDHLVRNEENIEMLFRYHDDHEERIKRLEDKNK
jgi:hypothetical protein